MVKELKNIRLPVMVTPSESEKIDEWMEVRGITTRAETMRDLLNIGMDLPMLCVDLLDALEVEGLLFYENLADPIKAMIDYLNLEVEIELTQLDKNVMGGKPYRVAREAIAAAREEIEEAKKQPQKRPRIRLVPKKKKE